MKLDFIKQAWGRLKPGQRWIVVLAAIFILFCGWRILAPVKYGGSVVLQPPGITPSSITASLLPATNNTYNLGSSSKSWGNIYASGTASLKYVSSTAITATKIWETTGWTSGNQYTSGTILSTGNIRSYGAGDFITLGANSSTQVASMFTARADATKKLLAFSASTTAYLFTIDQYGTHTITPANSRNAMVVNGDVVPVTNGSESIGTTSKRFLTGYINNFVSSVVTTTKLGLNTGGQISVGGVNPKRTIVLSGAGAWSPTTGGNLGTYQTEMTTNKNNIFLIQFTSSTIQDAAWDVVMPENYSGGAISAMYYVTATTTKTGTTTWALAAVAHNNGDNLDAAYGTAVTTTILMQGTANYVTTSTESSAITIGGSPRGGSFVQFRVRHDGKNTLNKFYTTPDLVMIKIRYPIKTYGD